MENYERAHRSSEKTVQTTRYLLPAEKEIFSLVKVYNVARKKRVGNKWCF